MVFFSQSIAIGLVLSSVSVSAFGATVAIIDSGVDYKHEALVASMWSNPNSSTTDVDGAKYQDDKNGWNFAENNNEIIDHKYVGTFSKDCYRMVETQGKILTGVATEEEKAWYKSKKEDQEFLKEMSKFGNFIHGTHVSGITADSSDAADIVGVKLIPTEQPGAGIPMSFDKAGNPLISVFLGVIAKRQAKLLITVGKYTDAVKARVANGSFGTSVAAVKPVVSQLVTQFTGKEPTEAELESYSKDFVNSILKESKGFPEAAKNTLFVFAAGNDGTNNDSLPVSPANIKLNNTITVAATLGGEKLATFSNYGVTNVEVAAPGVVIRAAIPGDEYLSLSGTSMAAPFVTNVATQIAEQNPSLTPVQIKKIIMDTVDKKAWLSGKVVTGGIVNKSRAAKAAEFSLSMSLDEAIQLSKENVKDMNYLKMAAHDINDRELVLAPLPAFFQ